MTSVQRDFGESSSASEPPITFSVVIPTHQGRRSVVCAVNSVLRQSYPHFDVIVVSDGDFLATHQILGDVSDPRLRIIEQPTRSGVALARNLGIDAAQASWVAFLDDDDVARSNWLITLASIITLSSAAVTCRVSFHRPDRPDVLRACRLSLTDTTTEASTILAGGFAVQRSILKAIGGYDSQLHFSENQDLGLRICDYVASVGTQQAINHTDQVLVDIYVGDSDARAKRYANLQSESAKFFLERYASRLAGASQERAALLRIISRGERISGNATAARVAALRACKVDRANASNWRTLLASLVPYADAARNFVRRAPIRRQERGHSSV